MRESDQSNTMDQSMLSKLLLHIGTPFAAAQAVWFLFKTAESVAQDEVRTAITRWLRNLDPDQVMKSWPQTFLSMFDSIFGKRHLSWRCIWRSCVASMAGVMVLMLVWATLRFDEIEFIINMVDPVPFFIMVIVSPLILNAVPDYVSLCETRFVLRWMSCKPSSSWIVLLLILDAVVTGLIFCLGAVVLILIVSGGPISKAIKILLGLLLPGLRLSSENGTTPFGIFFYSTYFTSVWVWLYVLSGGVIRTLGLGVRVLQKFLDIDNAPIRAIGFVASCIVAILLFIFIGVFVALKNWT